MPLPRRTALIALSTAALCALSVVVGAPGQAASPGSGRAIIRIDANSATVTKQAPGSYVLNLPTSSSGQWLGDRDTQGGSSRVVVGNLTARELVRHWEDFEYTDSGVGATVTWKTKSGMKAAMIHMAKPANTRTGVSVEFTSQVAVPKRLSGMTLNLLRAPGPSVRSYPVSQDIDLTDDLHYSISVSSNSAATGRLYNSTNNNTCWSGKFTSTTTYRALPDNTCDNVAYSDGSSYVSWAYDLTKQGKTYEYPGSNLLTMALTPPGEDEFEYSQDVLYWTMDGDVATVS